MALFNRTVKPRPFQTRLMPAGTARAAAVAQHSPFDRSMLIQAARVPRLRNVTAASQALRSGNAYKLRTPGRR